MATNISHTLHNAEKEIHIRFDARTRKSSWKKKGVDNIFTRWLSIHYGITAQLMHTNQYALCWEMVGHTDPEKLVMFKLRF